MAGRRKKLTKKEQAAVGRKIRKIKGEDSGLTQKQVVGRAVGIVKHEAKKRKRKRK